MSSITTQVDQLFAQWDKPDSPGCALAIIQNGEIIYKRGYGMANLEYDIPLSPNSVFDIGSTSKQFTAICIALLARQNLLSLDDELQKHIPEIPHYNHPITIRHLIHHISGLRDYPELMEIAGTSYENDYPREETLALIARQKSLNFEPGTEYLYCNSGYFLLVEIVRRVSGKSLRSFAEEQIFAPLGMRNTHFHDDFREIVRNRADGYAPKEKGGFQIEMSLLNVVGEGGLHTTIDDLFLWDQNFYCNQLGGYGQDLIEEVTTPGKLNNNQSVNYAFGLMIGKHRGLKKISHSGMWMGYRTDTIRFPDHNFSVIFLANLSKIDPIKSTLQVADLYLEHEFTEAATELVQSIHLPLAELETKTGFYRSQTTRNICELKIKDGNLIIQQRSIEFQLVSIEVDRFQLANNSHFTYEFPADTDQMRMKVDSGDGLQVHIWDKLLVTAPDLLTDYVGTYYSEETDSNYQVMLEGDKLKLKPVLSIEWICKDLLLTEEYRLECVRDDDDRVVGFDFCGNRVRRLRFTKQ
jgi:CubicO group peptidase (beta-lactamase class C family)